MSEFTAPRRPLAAWLPLALAALALIQVAYQARVGLDATDAGPFETVLARTVAGHFEPGAGPGRFYGPFDGSYPAVLMHAPLYYRLCALIAWPLVALGVEPISAALTAGRLLSLFGTLILALAVVRIGRLDPGRSRPGWIALALLLASPLFGNLAIMLRPDTIGVGLQTLGLWLVLQALESGENAARRAEKLLLAAAVAFGLAFCIKQQNVTVAAVGGLLLAVGAWRGQIARRSLALAAVAGTATVAAIIGAENWLTGGRMWLTVFRYPSGPFRSINYAGWTHVASVFDITARRLIGLTLLGACALAANRRPWLNTLDRVLLGCLGLEVLMLIPLCLFNAGAASNYALQALVFACLLVGRQIERLLETAATGQPTHPRWIGGGLASTVAFMALSHGYWVLQTERLRQAERTTLAELESDPSFTTIDPSARYFVTLQHLNRLKGNRRLIHDDWLYGAFEKATDAQPRNEWLREALSEGPVVQVVTPTDEPTVPGVEPPLTELGFVHVAHHGALHVWSRR